MNLNQVTVPVLNVTKSIRFYETLGMTLIVRALPDYARFVLPQGKATFSLHRVDELPKGEGVYVYFESDRLDAWVSDLQHAGMVFDLLPTDQPWLWREARLKDPEGNQLVLFHAEPNRKDPPWKVAPGEQ